MLEIPNSLRQHVIQVCTEAMHQFSLMPEKVYGDLIVDDVTQISLTLLGKKAPPELRKNIDLDRKKRQLLAKYLKKRIPECDYKIAGGNTIDITLAGVDKYTGIQKISRLMHVNEQNMLFIGDSVYPGGNDFSPFEHGIRTKVVKDEQDTLVFLEKIMENPEKFFHGKFYTRARANTISKTITKRGVVLNSIHPQPFYMVFKEMMMDTKKQKIYNKNIYQKYTTLLK